MNRKLVYGIGINDADYVTKIQETIGRIDGKQKQKVVWRCPFYARWHGMLRRCYSDAYKKERPTYKDCTVCKEWLTFSNFKRWMEQQDWEGKELDKDILVYGNKIYSPETCIFVTNSLNLFVMESFAKLGKYPSGVYFNKKRQKFYSQCKDPFGVAPAYLGSFETPHEAHIAWIMKKIEYVDCLSETIEDKRLVTSLKARYKMMLEKAKAAQDNLKEKIEELEEIEEIQNRYS